MPEAGDAWRPAPAFDSVMPHNPVSEEDALYIVRSTNKENTDEDNELF